MLKSIVEAPQIASIPLASQAVASVNDATYEENAFDEEEEGAAEDVNEVPDYEI